MILNKLKTAGFLAVIFALAWLAAGITNFSIVDGFRSIPRVVSWAWNNLYPNAEAMTKLPRIIDKLIETILMSIMASVSASLLSFFFALMGAQTTKINGLLSWCAKILASINRNIPVAAWAMIFLLAFGQSSFTGFLALFFATFGFLTRAYMEAIDDTAGHSIEALKASGASYAHIIAQSVIPATLPQMLSWTLFVIETNIRSAALVGLLTGSGIGFIFSIYYKSMQYSAASLVVISIVLVVLLIEVISNAIRRKMI